MVTNCRCKIAGLDYIIRIRNVKYSFEKRLQNKKLLYLAQAAMIAALYVVLTYVFAPISFSEIQVRIAEALTILPVFTSAAINTPVVIRADITQNRCFILLFLIYY